MKPLLEDINGRRGQQPQLKAGLSEILGYQRMAENVELVELKADITITRITVSVLDDL